MTNITLNFVFEDLDNRMNFVDCPDVNPSGIQRFTESPVASQAKLFYREKRKYLDIDFTKCGFFRITDITDNINRYIIPVGVAHSPMDWCGPVKTKNLPCNDTSRKNLFEYLNNSFIKDMIAGKAYLLLDQTHEGYHEPWLFEWFHISALEHNVPLHQIIYVTGNLRVHEQYQQWCKDNDYAPSLKTLPSAMFETMMHTTSLNRVRIDGDPPLPNTRDHLVYKILNQDTILDYNLLQKRQRPHRFWMFKEIVNAGLLNKGVNTINYFPRNITYFAGRDISDQEYSEISKYMPMLPPHQGNTQNELNEFSESDCGKYLPRFNEEIMLQTWVSVVSESLFDQDTCFISEKTFKPIAVSHPFIILGNKYSLAKLREMGYQTFSPFIDESYDNLDTWERLKAIRISLQKIAEIPSDQKLSWYTNMADIVDHNLQNIIKRSSYETPWALHRLDQILKTGN